MTLTYVFEQHTSLVKSQCFWLKRLPISTTTSQATLRRDFVPAQLLEASGTGLRARRRVSKKNNDIIYWNIPTIVD